MASEKIGLLIAAIYEQQASLLEPRLKELGLSWAAFQLLAAVQAAPDEPQAEIAERLGVSPATLSESVFRQVQAGLLEQAPSTKDRRVKSLKLTTKGRSMLKDCLKQNQAADAAMLRDLSEKERDQLARLLNHCLTALENHS